MPRMSSAQRRELLVKAASRVLVRDGFAAATTRAICLEAGMKQGFFHYCFTDRDELLREVAAGLLDAQVSASIGAVGGEGTITDAVVDALSVYWDAVEAAPGRHQVWFEITASVLRDRRAAEIARHHYRRYLDGIVQSLRQIAEIRRVVWDVPEDVMARQVVTVLDGLTLHYLIDRDGSAARAALRAFALDFAGHARSCPAHGDEQVPDGRATDHHPRLLRQA
jgi:AcrR family transcriptional regulator